MRPVRIQRKRTKGWRMPENTISVCRPGKWGNPFKVLTVRRRNVSISSVFISDTRIAQWCLIMMILLVSYEVKIWPVFAKKMRHAMLMFY